MADELTGKSTHHFTYSEVDSSVLCQGDLLRRTPELLDALGEYHSYFARDQYTYFMVLTQSCDLVRDRGRELKARYITLAAVRPLDDVIERAIEELPDNVKIYAGGALYCHEGRKGVIIELLQKLFNNNEPSHFFLKASPEHGLNQDSCAILHLSIPLKAQIHFDTCLNAKILQLTDVFRAKLGWLVGNIYSRVGTSDYVPAAEPDVNKYKRMIADLAGGQVVWVPKEVFSEIKGHGLEGRTVADIERMLNEREDRDLDVATNDVLTAIAREVDLDTQARTRLRNRLKQHAVVKRAVSRTR